MTARPPPPVPGLRPRKGHRLALPIALALLIPAVYLISLRRTGAEEGTPGAPAGAPVAPAPPTTPKLPTGAEANPLVIGTFPITPASIVDGDTMRTTGAKESIRILAVDTEEVFRNEQDKKDAGADFDAYAKAKRGEAPRPVKYGTPAGEAARTFARTLVEDVARVRLEREAAGAPTHGSYGRILAHVILLKPDGGELNFSEELIRAGHSPYFIKYGGSKRFDAVYRKAEEEARLAKRGIWGTAGPRHYPDYPERLAWWRTRLDQHRRWLEQCAALPAHVMLGTPTADAALRAQMGKPTTIFGVMRAAIETKSKDRHVLLLDHVGRSTFGLVVFDESVYKALDMRALSGMYLTARGTISLYKGRRPQMVIEKADQISLAPTR